MRSLVILTLFFLVSDAVCDLLRDTNDVHMTSAAAQPVNELWCYKCQAEAHDDECANLRPNTSMFIHKCHNEKRTCMVKRFSYTTSTENTTTGLKMWALERECTKSCTPGCIVIGERTKLYACTSCCEESLCNIGSDASKLIVHLLGSFLTICIALIL